MQVIVLVRPKPGILDPQGEVIARSLAGLGLPVENVRAGKVFDLEIAVDDAVAARAVATTAAERVLANELIEAFEVVIP
ncbi:MAG: phosphoribosylformylglycinamidine synthase subunit PurS [Gaiellales bacterium]|jgi:phosphoribosylformylglycinamidine synthase|nr:phosphoribosylformylglycinamidine synthase subunit PurS [Gaiellales bacterium]